MSLFRVFLKTGSHYHQAPVKIDSESGGSFGRFMELSGQLKLPNINRVDSPDIQPSPFDIEMNKMRTKKPDFADNTGYPVLFTYGLIQLMLRKIFCKVGKDGENHFELFTIVDILGLSHHDFRIYYPG
jgi:hypothetical protein